MVAGYTQVGTSAFTSYQAGECAVNGCFTLAGAGGTLATKGFFEFQFDNFINNPTYYNGLYSIFDVGYGTSGMTRDTLIGLINAQTATTGVTAMLPTQASDALSSSYFSEWLPANLQDSVVLRWQPNPAPQTASGLSAAFVVAWDLTAVNGFGGSHSPLMACMASQVRARLGFWPSAVCSVDAVADASLATTNARSINCDIRRG